jgi:hypothetical protein
VRASPRVVRSLGVRGPGLHPGLLGPRPASNLALRIYFYLVRGLLKTAGGPPSAPRFCGSFLNSFEVFTPRATAGRVMIFGMAIAVFSKCWDQPARLGAQARELGPKSCRICKRPGGSDDPSACTTCRPPPRDAHAGLLAEARPERKTQLRCQRPVGRTHPKPFTNEPQNRGAAVGPPAASNKPLDSM